VGSLVPQHGRQTPPLYGRAPTPVGGSCNVPAAKTLGARKPSGDPSTMNTSGHANHDDFESAFRPLFSLAYRIALRILGDPADAEDAASETLARTLASWPRLRRVSYLEAWVARVSSNVAIDVVRRRNRNPAAGPITADIPDPLSESDLVSAIVARGLLAKLPRRQRQVITMRYLMDMTEEQVADQLKISKGAVKSHGHRALESMRKMAPSR
jgi:RNA polymerase sigma factor (sigma-70 family)